MVYLGNLYKFNVLNALVGIKPSIVFSLAHAEQYEMKLNLYFGFGLAEIIQ